MAWQLKQTSSPAKASHAQSCLERVWTRGTNALCKAESRMTTNRNSATCQEGVIGTGHWQRAARPMGMVGRVRFTLVRHDLATLFGISMHHHLGYSKPADTQPDGHSFQRRIVRVSARVNATRMSETRGIDKPMARSETMPSGNDLHRASRTRRKHGSFRVDDSHCGGRRPIMSREAFRSPGTRGCSVRDGGKGPCRCLCP